MKIDKSHWQRVKFGDVVRLNTDRCADPAAAGIERYVGLEHIDPEDLRIRRWGLVEDGTTFTNYFRPGQVLFGKRRAYQRKIAIADFEGVCSSDIYVLEPRDDRLRPMLLPFLCQTEAFYEHAVGTSAGSLSPRTSWEQLATYELALPPIGWQGTITEVLQASDSALQETRLLASATDRMKQSMLEKVFCGNEEQAKSVAKDICDVGLPTGWKLASARTLCSELITKGATPSGELVSSNTGIPFLKVYNLTFSGALDFSIDPTFVTQEGHRTLERSKVLPGDVLTNIVGPPLGKVSIVPEDFPEANINQAIARFRPINTHFGMWLAWYLQSAWAQRWLLSRSKKTSGQRNITLELCRELPVPIPPHDVLNTLAETLAKVDHVGRMAQGRVLSLSRMHSSLLTTQLGG